MTNDEAQICTQLNDLLTLELKDSSMVDCLSNLVVLFSTRGPHPQIRGQFGCGVPFKVLMCYVL
jgi:hypothetical protein